MTRHYSYSIIDHLLVPLSDGTRLAAKIWMPESDQETGFPAVLEYLPYRKRDGTASRDDSTYPVFAQAGIVGVRVDISGHGESDGDFDDEYSPRELAQGVEVIEWISRQSWSNGRIGMMGISWGGFNGMQIAAMKPDALKAVISIGTTVDRYNDDIHYKNGCHLYSNFYWSNVMLTYAARPADPLLRNDWQAVWKARLQSQPFPLQQWLNHQRRDDYWKHGSVCEDYSDYQVPTLIIGGWADLYHNAPPALAANANATVKAINGPWIHKYPHFAAPQPQLDFHAEAIKWWNHWLRDEDTGSAELPAYRAFVGSAVTPGPRTKENGHWLACQTWPAETEHLTLFPGNSNQLESQPPANSMDVPSPEVTICSPLDCGTTCGEMFSLNANGDLAVDQRDDDGGSVVYFTPPLEKAVCILGRPSFSCTIAIDKPLGNLCVRLIDKHPDGKAYRVSWGVLNLAHRNGNEFPELMTPSEKYAIKIDLNECAYQFEPGHQIQLAISTNYWPAIHPPPEQITATLQIDKNTKLDLPSPLNATAVDIPEPDNPNLRPQYTLHSPASDQRWVEKDLHNQRTTYYVKSDTGDEEVPGHGMRTRHLRDEHWSIEKDNPLSMKAEGVHTWWSKRSDWQIKIECCSTMNCDEHFFYLTASVTAWMDDEVFNQRNWKEKIARDHM